MRNAELMTGFARTRIYLFLSDIVGNAVLSVPQKPRIRNSGQFRLYESRSDRCGRPKNGNQQHSQSRAGACSRRKTASFSRRLVVKPPYSHLLPVHYYLLSQIAPALLCAGIFYIINYNISGDHTGSPLL